MGFWPFGGGKRQRTVGAEEHRETLLRRTPSDAQAQHEKVPEKHPEVQRASSKTRRGDDKSRRLSKTRTSSSKALARPQPLRAQQDPSGQTSFDTRRISRSNSQYNEKSLYQQVPLSQSSLQPENFTVIPNPPTLHAKRVDSDSQLPRRKSSKRKAEDVAREREIRAMTTSSPIPIPRRPTTLYGTGPLQRDSKHFAGPLNRRLERPTSEISLPLPGSLLEVTDFPNQNSFKVGMLAALSPRPTIRYDANPKMASGKQPMRPNMAIQRAIEEEDVSDKKRINELADDLDAGGLRELMERDRRRRERKKEVDKIKLQRRLQRRAERQREEEEARRARTEAYVQSAPISSSQAYGLGIDSPARPGGTTTVVPEDTDDGDPFTDPDTFLAVRAIIRNPFEDEKDMDIMQDLHNSDNDDDAEADDTGANPAAAQGSHRPIETSTVGPREKPSQSTLSPPVSPVNRPAEQSSLSQGSFLNPEINPDIPGRVSIERRTSGASSQRMSSWTTFFKRGSRRKFTGPSQGRTTPSEFSNTSRESFSRKQPPVMAPRTFRRSDSATPQRTLSRFREDLPELPISPPDSRLQSPEAAVLHVTSTVAPGKSREDSDEVLGATTPDRSKPSNIPLPDQPDTQGLTDLDNALPSSAGMILSQSLASVDSEASWLSGKPPKRQSGLSHAFKPSQSSLPGNISGNVPDALGRDEQDEQDVGLKDDDISRLDGSSVPLQSQHMPLHGASADSPMVAIGRDQSGSENVAAAIPTSQSVDQKWHPSIEKQATIVGPPGRTRSDEGLVEELAEGESPSDDDEIDSALPSPGIGSPEVPILRARSVDYKKGHARHISAGSAKLLDIRHSDNSRPSSIPRSVASVPKS